MTGERTTARILYLNAASTRPEVGLVDADGRLGELREMARHGDDPRGRLLFSTLDELLDAAGLHWSDLDSIAVGVGPGPMTGTRLSVAAAQGLSRATGLLLRPLPQWFGFADPAAVGEEQQIEFRISRLGIAVATVRVDPEGWRLRDPHMRFAQANGPWTARVPSAATLAAAAATIAPRMPVEVEPIYLREPDVRPQYDALGNPIGRRPGA